VPLTNISVAYIQREDRFIADKVFPVVPSDKQSNRYFTYDKSYWFRTQAQERAPSTESAGSGWAVDSTPTYFCRVFAVHKDVDDQTRANTDTPLDMDRDATIFCTQQMLLRKDQLWVTKYFTTGIWAGITGAPLDVTGAATAAANQVIQWDRAGSDPINDVTTYAMRMDEQTGFRPNTLVITPYVEQKLLVHPVILDRIKYTQGPAIPTLQLLAQLFNVERVLVARATQNTAQEAATATMSYVASTKGALLLYVNPTPSIMMPSAGYTFSWSGLYGAGAMGTRTKRMRMEHLESDRIEMEMAYDHKVVAADCGIFFNTIVQ
jgi:hypothetical protein